QYEGARILLEYPILDKSCKLSRNQNLFALAYFRFYGMQKEALYHSRRKDQTIENHLILKKYRDGSAMTSNTEMVSNFGSENSSKVVELLCRSFFYKNLGDYNSSILDLSRCYEYFLYASIEAEYGYKLLSGNFKYESNNFIQYILRNRDYFCHVEQPDPGVPTWINVGLSSNLGFVKALCHKIAPFISYTSKAKVRISHINNIRNQVAHSGLFISQEYYEKEMAYYPQLLNDMLDLLGVEHPNLFEELAEIVTMSI
ncbi:MAG: hypothetical protein KDC80_12650, partial [Saprospiraceae bacterium]|nr:hypothetical protein [Saprospiraceae bacterium]